jgi:hypothetical protein
MKLFTGANMLMKMQLLQLVPVYWRISYFIEEEEEEEEEEKWEMRNGLKKFDVGPVEEENDDFVWNWMTRKRNFNTHGIRNYYDER